MEAGVHALLDEPGSRQILTAPRSRRSEAPHGAEHRKLIDKPSPADTASDGRVRNNKLSLTTNNHWTNISFIIHNILCNVYLC